MVNSQATLFTLKHHKDLWVSLHTWIQMFQVLVNVFFPFFIETIIETYDTNKTVHCTDFRVWGVPTDHVKQSLSKPVVLVKNPKDW